MEGFPLFVGGEARAEGERRRYGVSIEPITRLISASACVDDWR